MDYPDQELSVIALPHAVALVNQEIFRLLNKCNTKEIEGIVTEFVNIMKYGTVNAPTIPIVKEPVIVDNVPQPAQTTGAAPTFA